MEDFQKIKALVSAIEDDVERFYKKGNKSAGVRVRKGLQEVKKLIKQMRKDILERRKKQL